MINEKDILAYLEKVQYPGFSRNIVSFGLVKSISIEENDVVINIGRFFKKLGGKSDEHIIFHEKKKVEYSIE